MISEITNPVRRLEGPKGSRSTPANPGIASPNAALNKPAVNTVRILVQKCFINQSVNPGGEYQNRLGLWNKTRS